MVTFNTHIIDQIVKDKFHPFIASAVAPLIPIHYEKIQLSDTKIIVDMFAQEHGSTWNCVSKRFLIVGELVNGKLKVIEKKQINNINYRAPLPCSDSNTNSYTEKNCDWNKKYPITNTSIPYVPKEQGNFIQDIKYEQRSYDELRYRDPKC